MTGKPATWKWLETSEYGGQDGSVLTKLFKGKENLSAEELLAREVIQNSWDAALVLLDKYPHEHLHFEMVFRFASLTGDAKSDLVDLAGLSSLKSRREAVPAGSELDDDTALLALDDPSVPLRILYLEDYGSHGLHGDPDKKRDSHLFKALYLVGGTGKTEENAAQGGSFGFGKSAFVRASGTNTVIAHSVFEPLPDDNVTSRLVGWTWWPGYAIDGTDYEGRAIFGANEGGHIVPMCDGDADSLAARLGMPSRRPSTLERLGTTFLLVDPVVDPVELKKAVEVHWWPALEDHLMDVRIIDYDGNELIPRPSKVEWLAPYIEAYRIATSVSQVVDPDKQRRPSDKWRAVRGEGVPPGELGLVISDVEVPEELKGPRVALIRGPRMVIDYKPFLRKSLPIYGAFVASKEADPLLRKTEPPAHDLWDAKPNSDTPAEATKTAKGTLDRIKRAVVEFADEFQPPPPQDGQRLDLMAQLLSSFLRNKPVLPPGEHEPISIQFPKPERAVVVDDDLIAVEAGIRIALTDSFKGGEMHVRVSSPVVISEDEGGHGERWPATFQLVSPEDGFRQEADGSWVGTLVRGRALDFDLRSRPFDAEWTAIVHPRVERLSGEEAT